MTTPSHLKTHRDLALEALEDARHFRQLREDERGEAQSPGALIASCNDRIGFGLATAKVHAHLAIAEAIAASFPALPLQVEEIEPMSEEQIERLRTLIGSGLAGR